MAFETNIVAISWIEGKYEVESSITAAIDIETLRSKQPLIDVSEDRSYMDLATIVSRIDFKNYLLEESVPWGSSARKWYASLSERVRFILVHEAEWESGLG
ncbi:MAG: hypothetical protein HOD11_03825 [Candidatus Marinimicrobia bacterium]|jgi:hypothetical protein|nr:hypothetical protein [Candidatus Neomarinimicrobiota bacterium]